LFVENNYLLSVLPDTSNEQNNEIIDELGRLIDLNLIDGIVYIRL